LAHLDTHVVQKLFRIGDRAGNFLAQLRALAAVRFLVLHFHRVTCHSTPCFLSPTLPDHPTEPRPSPQNYGRGGGTRTPIPGFGDRSPSRWTTPLNRQNLAIHPEAAPVAA